jgi:hypothetical protein
VAPPAINEAIDKKTDVLKASVPVLPIESKAVSKMVSEPVQENAGTELHEFPATVPDAFKNEAMKLEPVDIKADPIVELSEPVATPAIEEHVGN